MKDRQPTEILANGALRYGIYNADGTLNRYEYIKPEDEPTEVGSPLNKANLLPDDVAAALGLTGDPQVKDALGKLGILFQYAWRKTPYSIAFDIQLGPSASPSVAYNQRVLYGSEFEFVNQTVRIKNPITISITNASSAIALKGKYWVRESDLSSSTLYYFFTDVNASNPYEEYGRINIPNSHGVTVSTSMSYGATEIIYNISPEAYPKRGTDDNAIYEYIGWVKENASKAISCNSVSYVGFGTYGENNPNSLIIGYGKSILFVDDYKYQSTSLIRLPESIYGVYITISTGNAATIKLKYVDDTIYWYSTADAEKQYNTSGSIYRFIAI